MGQQQPANVYLNIDFNTFKYILITVFERRDGNWSSEWDISQFTTDNKLYHRLILFNKYSITILAFFI